MNKHATRCNRCQLIQIMARDEHGLTLFSIQSADKGPYTLDAQRVQPICRLIENEYVGFAQQSRSYIQPPFHSQRKTAHALFLIDVQPDKAQNARNLTFLIEPPFRTSDPKILSRTEGLVCSAGIWHIADTRPHQTQLFFRLASKELHTPRRWPTEAQHYFNKRAFTRPVCTNKGAKLRLTHLEGNVMQHTPFSIAL